MSESILKGNRKNVVKEGRITFGKMALLPPEREIC